MPSRRLVLLCCLLAPALPAASLPYPIVDTGQSVCYDADGPIPCPEAGSTWSGQDAQFEGLQADLADQGDGTVLDKVTGLSWVQARGPELSWQEAVDGAKACRVGGYPDWRLPTVKELYSLMDFKGRSAQSAEDCIPYLNAQVFGFAYGDAARGERVIDAQDWSADEDLAPTMGGDASVFGVNFIDGRIKSYPKADRRRGQDKKLYARYVRGNPAYGKNDFALQADATVLDRATGLAWDQDDSGQGMDWPAALAWVRARNAEAYKGHDDWRLPNAKELQSLVDYKRGPGVDGKAAIDPLFKVSGIRNEAGQADVPFFWTSTTHRENLGAVYVCFGRAMGYLKRPNADDGRWLDVHGAGAQRSDPKTGSAADYPQGHGPQGDAVRVQNFVRLVRGGGVQAVAGDPAPEAEARRGPGPGAPGREASEEPSSRHGRRQPPQEAQRACEGHREGDRVSFLSPRGDRVDGECRSMDGLLFAVPAGRP